MNRPNLVNLDRFKKKVRNLNGPTLSMPAQDAKALDADIDALLQYTIHIQAMYLESVGSSKMENVDLVSKDFFTPD